MAQLQALALSLLRAGYWARVTVNSASLKRTRDLCYMLTTLYTQIHATWKYIAEATQREMNVILIC